MNRDDIRKWAEDRAAAASRELREMNRNPPSAGEAFQSALALLVYDEARNGSPFDRADSFSDLAHREMWDRWAILRARWNRAR